MIASPVEYGYIVEQGRDRAGELMRYAIAALALLTSAAQAQTISGVATLSDDLGYESTGYGLQLDHTNRHGDWGYAIQGTALSHAKQGATGNRYVALATARRHSGDWHIEAGARWGGYSSKFPDGTSWTKYGHSAGFGIGHGQWSLRYWLPNSTPNETSIIALTGSVPISGRWRATATFEHWRFNHGDERLSGEQVVVGVGYDF